MMRTRTFIPRNDNVRSIRVRKYTAVGTCFGDHLFGDLMALGNVSAEKRTRHVDTKMAPCGRILRVIIKLMLATCPRHREIGHLFFFFFF